MLSSNTDVNLIEIVSGASSSARSPGRVRLQEGEGHQGVVQAGRLC